MPNLLKKSIFSFLAGLILLFSFAPYLQVKAAKQQPQATPAPTGTWYNQNFKDWWNKVYNPSVSPDNEIFGERYTAAQVQWVIYGLWAFIFNIVIPQNVTACLLTNTIDLTACGQEIKTLLSQSPSTSGMASTSQTKNQTLLGSIFATDRPISGISYVKNLIQNFSLVPVAHAQSVGFGFSALEPVQGMWRGFRNIAYSLFVLVAIIFAFMIMFRVKISPQVVITVQSAIPKLILALILVSFSYAIAGFLVDFMYIVIGLISLAASTMFSFSAGPISLGPTQYFNFLTLGQPLGGNFQIGIFFLISMYLLIFFVGLIVLVFVGGGLAGIGASLIYSVLILLFVVVAAVVAIFVIFKTIWALFKAFAMVLLLTVFAPLQLTIGTLVPAMGFGAWLKSYLAALSTFVVTGVLILFSYIFAINGITMGLSNITGGNGIVSAIVQGVFGNVGQGALNALQGGSSNAWPPLLGSAGTVQGLLFLVVSFVFFTMIPKATDIVQGFITGKPFAYGSAVGEAIMGPVTGGLKVMSTAQDIGTAITTRFGTRRPTVAPPPPAAAP